MPVYFWNDPDYRRYRESYFGYYPGVWRHGDWLQITPQGGVRLLGRSDATLNRQGVRIGTAEIYRALDKIAEVADSLIVNLERSGGKDFMRSEEHTSELQSLMRISYAVFCLKKKKKLKKA